MAYPERSWTSEDLDLIENRMAEQSRLSFWAFRQYMHPKLIKGWWIKDASHRLQRFYDDMLEGRRPKLLIMAPPQHGKSMMITDFIAWVLGHNPDMATIYASFSSRLGARANLQLQRIMATPRYRRTFPGVGLPEKGDGRIRNTEMIEIVGGRGLFRNTTVRGSITGEGLDLGVVDDPIKGHEEAKSALIRDKTWAWLTDDFMTRFSDSAALLGVMTRWHLDDPFGRLLESDPTVQSSVYRAIAESDEKNRREGDALFPEHKSLEFLHQRRAMMAEQNWAALYQQSPMISGGNMFKSDWWKFWAVPPRLEWRMIYADTAAKTKTQNDFTVMQCWGRSVDGQAVLLDQVRGKWEAPELRVQMRAFWNNHRTQPELRLGHLRGVRVEDASSGTGLIQELKREGIPITGLPRGVDKVTRGYDAAPFIEAGLVILPEEAPWLSEFMAEASAFPNGAHDDQIDPMLDAIKEVLASGATEMRVRTL